MSENIERVAENDPNRCQGVTAFGQCQAKAIPGLRFCTMHAARGREVQKENVHRNYLLGKWQAKVEQKKCSPDLKNLRDEIAILRMLLEERLQQCESPTDLLLHGSAISDLTLKIKAMVESCHKLEEKMGNVLDRQQILDFASRIITILGNELSGQDTILDKISNKILVAIGELGNENT